MSSYEEKRF